jgi:hypothetical protein
MDKFIFRKYINSIVFFSLASVMFFAGFLIPFAAPKVLNFVSWKKQHFLSIQIFQDLSGVFLLFGLLFLIIGIFFAILNYKVNNLIQSIILSANNKIKDDKLNLMIFIGIIFFLILNLKEIYNGFFLWDDFAFLANKLNFNYLLIPQNDHTLPLFRLEMFILFKFFGFFSLPYNLFIFSIFIGIIIFSIKLLRQFDVGYLGITTFLILFIGFAQWRSYLSGFYIISVYLQSVLFFLISVWLYSKWVKSPNNLYLFFLFIFLCFGVFIDIAGIWTLPFWLLFTFTNFIKKNNSLSIPLYLRTHLPVLFIFSLAIILVVGINFYVFFYVYPDNFLISKLDYDYHLFDYAKFLLIFVSGTFLTLFINNEYFPFLHVGFNKIPIYISLIFSFIILSSILYKYFKGTQLKSINVYLLYFLISLFGISLMVVYGRPPDLDRIIRLDARYVGMPVIILMLVIAIIIDSFFKRISNFDNKYKFMNGYIILAIIYFVNQQFLDHIFYRFSPSIPTPAVSAAIKRQKLWNNLQINVLERIDSLGKANGKKLYIPNLDQFYLNSMNSNFYGTDLSFFYNRNNHIKFIRNAQMNSSNELLKVNSLLAKTDVRFFDLLKIKEFGNFFFYPVTLKSDSFITKNKLTQNENLFIGKTPLTLKNNGIYKVELNRKQWNPEQYHYLELELELPPGNIPFEMNIYFKNDFNQKGSLGKIKIDLPYWCEFNLISFKLSNTYLIKIDLLQMYAYSLSESIEDITLKHNTKSGAECKINYLRLY